MIFINMGTVTTDCQFRHRGGILRGARMGKYDMNELITLYESPDIQKYKINKKTFVNYYYYYY